MKDLVALLEGLGASHVETYIQSGNAVFRHAATRPAGLAGEIGAAIAKARGFESHALVLEATELEKAMASNPFPEAESDPKSLHLFFLAAAPKNPDLTGLEDIAGKRERFAIRGRVFYLHAPDGVGKSRLAARAEKALGVAATARNWRTVCKITAMARQCG
jgi:uncharacterized protein (DUF1697 family)